MPGGPAVGALLSALSGLGKALARTGFDGARGPGQRGILGADANPQKRRVEELELKRN